MLYLYRVSTGFLLLMNFSFSSFVQHSHRKTWNGDSHNPRELQSVVLWWGVRLRWCPNECESYEASALATNAYDNQPILQGY